MRFGNVRDVSLGPSRRYASSERVTRLGCRERCNEVNEEERKQ